MTALIAQSQVYRTIFEVVTFMCFAPELYRSFFKHVEKGAVKRDRGSHAWLLIAICSGCFVAFGVLNGAPETVVRWRQPVVFWTGIAVMLAGLAFRTYSIKHLGAFFTHTVATRASQYVVDTGPYRLIRHPSYSGSLLMFLGMGLAMTDWASLLAIMAAGAIGLGYRVRVEERALCEGLGQPYRDYMLRTKRFIPHVW